MSRRALIASRIYRPEPAAASFRLGALERELLSRGMAVTVLTTHPRAMPGGHRRHPDDPTHAGLKISRWPALRDANGYIRGYLPYLSFDLPLLVRLLLARRPDVVVVEPPPTTGVVVRVACALRRIPYVYYAADVWSVAARETGAPNWVTGLVRVLERTAWAGASRVVSVYSSLVAAMTEVAPGVSVELVGHGADTDVFRPDGPVPPIDGPYLVYAGTASEVHGAGLFVEAWSRVVAELPGARLVVIGQGEDRPAMEAAAAGLPAGSVRFLPVLDPGETASWIRGAHSALASVRPGPYGFALATKVFAAAACGTPVVYVGGGEGHDLVQREALGVTVGYDVAAATDAMVAALRTAPDPAHRQRLREWALAHGSLQAAARRAADVVEGLVEHAR